MAPSELNPRTTELEWMGIPGACSMVLGLPIAVVGLNAMCSSTGCSLDAAPQFVDIAAGHVQAALPNLPTALGLTLLWYAFHCAMYLAPWGARPQGMPLRAGRPALTYNMNALHAMAASYLLAIVGHVTGIFDFGTLAPLFMPLALAALLLAFAFSLALHVASYRSDKVLLALGGNTGNLVYDFWVGRELNPRLGELDLKFMFELRPGLIGWTLLNWAFVVHAQQQGTLTLALVLVAFMQTMYVGDGLLFEAGNLTMMDIVHDGFGFMLVCGDIAWVPFLYTLQGSYLYHFPQHHSAVYLALCTVLHFGGYALFRGSNSQKDTFRKDPKHPAVAHLEVMKTSAGKSLITSGYWGVCRHPNYVGDWVMTLAWSMLCGPSAVLPYFQPIYFAALLMHRQLRDEVQMKHKYGDKDWKAFCDKVPYRLIPNVY
jgi:delta14-sterol reductase